MPRPKGLPKTGGRSRGVPNRKTQAIAARLLATDKSPLEVMLEIMHAATDPVVKLDAAKAAAPYMHPRLASIEQTGPNKGPILTESVVRYDLSGLSADDLTTMQALLEKTGVAAVH
jgi:hypothetical protein